MPTYSRCATSERAAETMSGSGRLSDERPPALLLLLRERARARTQPSPPKYFLGENGASPSCSTDSPPPSGATQADGTSLVLLADKAEARQHPSSSQKVRAR